MRTLRPRVANDYRVVRKFDIIPPEIRLKIYQLLFAKAKVEVCARDLVLEPWKIGSIRPNTEAKMGLSILLTSRQLYQEARPILASCMKLMLVCADLDMMPPAIRDFYLPLIQRIECAACFKHAPDLSIFKSLKKLTLLPEAPLQDYALYAMHKYHSVIRTIIKTPHDDHCVSKMIEGGLDERLKSKYREWLIDNETWISDLLHAKDRGYTVFFDLDREETYYDSRRNPRLHKLRLKYNLDDMTTTKRSAGYSYNGKVYDKIWRKGRIELWVNTRKWNPWLELEIETWDQDEYQALSSDLDMLNLKICFKGWGLSIMDRV